jgi:SpoVK/Ycf46/Vps4 family AAA+-type ATPase
LFNISFWLVVESGATFIGIKASTILNKWVGESEKLITALFSLARKLAPTVIFIDEVDTLLKNRNGDSGPTSLSASLGAFMAEWDGLQSVSDAPVVVVGATNRPEDVDPAFRRRMPLTVHTLPPDQKGRSDILRINLRSEPMAENFDFDAIATATEGFTGAELKELCRLVTLERLKAALGRGEGGAESPVNASGGYRPAGENNAVNTNALRRPLRNEDFCAALEKMNAAKKTVETFKVEKQATLGDLIEALSSPKILEGKGV